MIPIATETEKKPSAVEVVKRESHHLRGAITEELANDSATFTEASRQVLKFHGIYPQDDRDLRRSLRQAGKEPRHIMMVRARIPGGILSAEQYLTCDDVTNRYGDAWGDSPRGAVSPPTDHVSPSRPSQKGVKA